MGIQATTKAGVKTPKPIESVKIGDSWKAINNGTVPRLAPNLPVPKG